MSLRSSDTAPVHETEQLDTVFERLRLAEIGTPVRRQSIPLYDHQKVGVDWLVQNALNGPGALLADSMGLGKTAQVVAGLTRLYEIDRSRFFPCIIVCPASTLYHWDEALQKWGFSGKHQIAHRSNRTPRHDPHECDVLVTTARGWTDAVYWHTPSHLKGLVIDEASSLKSASTSLTRCAHACSHFLSVRWALSATPSENRLLELKQIFEFVEPGLLGDDETFRVEFSDPVRRGTRPTATAPEVAAAAGRCKTLYALVAPFFKRRTRIGNAAKIKPRSELVVWTIMGKQQECLYRRVERKETHARSSNLFKVLAGTHPECGAKMKIGKFEALKTMLRQFVLTDHQRVWQSFTNTKATSSNRGVPQRTRDSVRFDSRCNSCRRTACGHQRNERHS